MDEAQMRAQIEAEVRARLEQEYEIKQRQELRRQEMNRGLSTALNSARREQMWEHTGVPDGVNAGEITDATQAYGAALWEEFAAGTPGPTE